MYSHLLRMGLPVLVLLASFAAAAEDGTPINETCPVMLGEPINPRITVVYEGKTIGLCCLRCKRDWMADPEKYIANVPGFEDRAPSPVAAPAEEAGRDRAIRFAGKFHPVLVHFPIALVLAALLAELLKRLTGRAVFDGAARFSLVVATMGAIVAAPLGWAAAAFSSYPGLGPTMEQHRWVGTAGAAVILAAAVLGALSRRGRRFARIAYPLALLAAAALVGLAGHLGGMLVFGPDHYRW